MERWKFSREFKLEAVSLVRDRGVTSAQASRDLSVEPHGLVADFDAALMQQVFDVPE